MKILDNLDLERLQSDLCCASRRYTIDARLENYSCKMVTEEKRQYKQMVKRICGTDGNRPPDQKLGSSQTIRRIYDMSGHPVDPETYQMSNFQDPYPPQSNTSQLGSTPGSGKKRKRTDTESSSDMSLLPASPQPPTKQSVPSIPLKELFNLMSTLNSCFGPEYDFLAAGSDEFCLEPELWVVKKFISQFCSVYVDKYENLSGQLWETLEEAVVPHHCVIYSYRPDHHADPYSSGCLSSFNYFFYNRAMKRILFFTLRVLNDPIVIDKYAYQMQDLF